MVIEQKELNEQKVTGKVVPGKVVPLENPEPCCLPGCCNNNSSGKK